MKTRSNIIKRLLSLALCICMVLALVPAINLTANAEAPKKLILDATNWGYGDARFAAYFFGNGEKWVSMTALGEGIYACDVPSGFSKVIFCRMNGGSTTNSWDNKWNQTGDLTIPTNGNDLFTIKQWDNQTSGWSVAPCKYSGDHIYEYDSNGKYKCTAGCGKSKCVNDKAHSFNSDNVCSYCGTKGKVVYFQNNWLWTDVRVHYWKDGDVDTGHPGVALTEPEMAYGPDKENDYWEHYRVIIPEDCDGFQFNGINQNTNVREQSNDLSLVEYYDGIAYWMLYDEKTQAKTAESFAICLALTDLHKVGDDDNKCSVCNETRCKIYGHKYEDNVCIYCGLSVCDVSGHNFNKYDVCTVCGVEQIWVFFENNWNWSDIHLHYWYDGVPDIIEWPGVKMGFWKSTSGSTNLSYMKVQIPADVDGIQINGIKDDTSGDRDKTPDILASELEDGLYNGITFKLLWVDGVGNQIHDPYEMAHTDCSVYHIYGETTYTWAEDYSTCTATRSCTACGKKTDTETVNVVVTEVKAGTCVAPTQVRYDADFAKDINWAADQNAAGELEKNPDNHAYGSHYVDNGDGTHMFICNACDVPVTESEVHNRDRVMFAGNCLSPAIYQCSVCNTVIEGELNFDNHPAIAVKFDNGDGTHTEKWACCMTPLGEAEAHADADENGYCDGCHVAMNDVFLKQVVADLKGKIGLHYYFALSDEVLADPEAHILFTVGDETIKISVNDAKAEWNDNTRDTYYVFTYEVCAKEMTNEVLTQFYFGGEAYFDEPRAYSVKRYGNHILDNPEYNDDVTKNLMNAMLNYGAAAQTHFGYNTDSLASSETVDYSNVKIQGYDVKRGMGTANAKFYSASLILNAETTLRLFFNAPIASATCEDQELQVKERKGLYYVDVTNISAKDLDENVIVTINDGTETADITFNPMAYCQSIQNDTTGAYSAELQDLVCALYLYNQAANEYFGN